MELWLSLLPSPSYGRGCRAVRRIEQQSGGTHLPTSPREPNQKFLSLSCSVKNLQKLTLMSDVMLVK